MPRCQRADLSAERCRLCGGKLGAGCGVCEQSQAAACEPVSGWRQGTAAGS